jgi:hypothetical protein
MQKLLAAAVVGVKIGSSQPVVELVEQGVSPWGLSRPPKVYPFSKQCAGKRIFRE